MKHIVLLVLYFVLTSNLYADSIKDDSAMEIITNQNLLKPKIKTIRRLLTNYIKYSDNTLKKNLIDFIEISKNKNLKVSDPHIVNDMLTITEESSKNALYLIRNEGEYLQNNHEGFAALMSFYSFLSSTKIELLKYYTSNRNAVSSLDYLPTIRSQKSKLKKVQEDINALNMLYAKYLIKKDYDDWWKRSN